jgi:hypothetical protein
MYFVWEPSDLPVPIYIYPLAGHEPTANKYFSVLYN